MEKKYTKIEQGTFKRVGKLYDYIVEAGPEPKDIRVRIIQERPVVKKIRTRYDPEIQLFGDKGAAINVSLGYSMRQIKSAISIFWSFLVFIVFFILAEMYMPRGFLSPSWIWVVYVLVALLFFLAAKLYLCIFFQLWAEYLKARDIQAMLLKEGYKK